MYKGDKMGVTTRYQGTCVFDKLQVHKGKFYVESYAMPLQWTVAVEHDMGADAKINTTGYTVVVPCKLAAVWVTVTEAMTGNAATEVMEVCKAVDGASNITTADYTLTKAETVFSNVINSTSMLPCSGTSLAAGDVVYLYTAVGVGGDRTAGKVMVTMLFEAV